MKRKILVSALAVALVALISLGATVAYFQASAGKAENVFTFGNVNGELTEPAWKEADAVKLAPGKELPKDPKITLGADSLNAYAFMKVTVSDAAALKTATEADDAGLLTAMIDGLGKGWKLMNTPAAAADSIVYIYGYETILTKGDVTADIFKSVTVPTGINETYFGGENTTLDDGFNIDVQGYLIQSENIADLATAYAGVDFTK